MTVNRVKVLVFDPSNRNPIHTAHLIDELSKRCSVNVVMPYRREEEEIEAGKSIGRHRAVAMPPHVKRNMGKIFAYIRGWLYVLTNASRFDIIHVEWLSLMNYTGIELILMRKLLRTNPNVVYTIHDVIPLHAENQQRTRVRYERLYKMVPSIFVHSVYAKGILQSSFLINPSKIHVIDLAPLLEEKMDPVASTKDRNAVGMIGAIKPYKGVIDAIKAFSLIASKTDVKLLLAGGVDSKYKRVISDLISTLHLTDRVTLTDKYLTTFEVIDLHRKLKVALFPYHRITQSGAVLVALNFGIPVVAYDVGGIPELIDIGRTGYISKVGDIEGFAKNILEILADQHTDYYQRCRMSVQHRSWSNFASQVLDVYQEILRPRAGHSGLG